VAEAVNGTGRWLLKFGTHRGTVMSRDCGTSEHGSEGEARDEYLRQRASVVSDGDKVWLAEILPPGAAYSGGWVTLEQGGPYP
jgi:hypothetical protein